MRGRVETEGARQGGRDPDHPQGMQIGKRCAYRPVSTLNTPSLAGKPGETKWKEKWHCLEKGDGRQPKVLPELQVSSQCVCQKVQSPALGPFLN